MHHDTQPKTDEANESGTGTSIEVDVPVRVAYNQWTQFEEFPKFMGGVQSVKQLDDDLVHFTVSVAGHTVEYDAQITEQVPDRRIVWESVDGRETGGNVTFQSLGPNRTKVTLSVCYEPKGVLEKIGDLVNVVGLQAKTDLARFKTFIEARGRETGEWRGVIQ
jgi:uncharacterized membrane protein